MLHKHHHTLNHLPIDSECHLHQNLVLQAKLIMNTVLLDTEVYGSLLVCLFLFVPAIYLLNACSKIASLYF